MCGFCGNSIFWTALPRTALLLQHLSGAPSAEPCMRSPAIARPKHGSSTALCSLRWTWMCRLVRVRQLCSFLLCNGMQCSATDGALCTGTRWTPSTAAYNTALQRLCQSEVEQRRREIEESLFKVRQLQQQRSASLNAGRNDVSLVKRIAKSRAAMRAALNLIHSLECEAAPTGEEPPAPTAAEMDNIVLQGTRNHTPCTICSYMRQLR